MFAARRLPRQLSACLATRVLRVSERVTTRAATRARGVFTRIPTIATPVANQTKSSSTGIEYQTTIAAACQPTQASCILYVIRP